jgi:hypothetical protein
MLTAVQRNNFYLKHGLTLIERAPRGTYRCPGVLSVDLAQN